MNQQFILPLQTNVSYFIEDFIVSSSNSLAYNSVKQWSLRWGHQPYLNSLIIYGPKSSGKTYLARIWQQFSSAYILTPEDNLELALLELNSAFIIEDIGTWQEEKLLHCFNLLNENKKYLLMTAESRQNFALKDLFSRINSIYSIQIEQPDDELVKILLFKFFSSKDIKIPSKVVEFLALRIPRQIDLILESVDTINQFALVHKRSITIPLIKEALDL